MFQRFTDSARQVVVLAQEEARLLKHNYIGTEHILLGLLAVRRGVAADVLESLDITLGEVRAQIARIVGQGDEVTTGQIPFTPRAKRVLELSLREALSLGDDNIETKHILLAIVAEKEGVAARILRDFDADAEMVRIAVMELHHGSGQSERAGPEPDEPMDALPPISYSQMGSRSSTMRLSREVSFGGQAPLWGPLAVRAHLWFGMLVGALVFGAGLLIGRLIWG